jgi:cupin 2 domain-containing protein
MNDRLVDIQQIESNWNTRGFHGGLWIDPPGQVWEDYIHDVDELVMLVDGEVEVELLGSTHRLRPGEELFIPAQTVHTVRTVGSGRSRWLYAYRRG